MESIDRRKFNKSLGFASISAALFTGVSACESEITPGMEHDYKIYPQGEVFVVKSQVTDEIVAEKSNAATAIQTAIDLLETGGEVFLHRGKYPIDQPLKLKNNVSLRGSGRGTRLELTDNNKEGIGIHGQGFNGAMASRFSIDGSNLDTSVAGILLDDCGDCTVSDVYAKNFSKYGIWVRNNSFLCEIKSCKLANNKEAGILMENLSRGGRGGDYVPNLIHGCIAYAGGTGIECKRSIVVNIVACMVHQPKKFGFHIHSISNSVLLSGCRTFQCLLDAVRVEDSHELNISSNIFCWHRGNGIHLKNVSWGILSGNEVIDSGSERQGGEAAIGIEMREKVQGVQVTGNTIFNWGGQGLLTYGVREDKTCLNNAFTNNNLNFILKEAIVSKGSNTITVNNIYQKDPAYQGSPEHPDALFDDKRLMDFING